EQGDNPFLTLDRAFAALEVEARADLARHSGKRVVDLGEIDPRDYVEARQGGLLCNSLCRADIARPLRQTQVSGITSDGEKRAPSPPAPLRARPEAPNRAGCASRCRRPAARASDAQQAGRIAGADEASRTRLRALRRAVPGGRARQPARRPTRPS